MSSDKVLELLERWDDLNSQGRQIAVEELCQECPELAREVASRIRALKATEWLEEPVGDGNEVAGSKLTPDELGLPPKLGRYELKRLIGEGGFGYVLEGHDPELQRSVAVKVARPNRAMTAEQVERFLLEARHAAQLKHPGIVPIHDVGQDGKWCYIVSDLVEGRNLASLVQEARPTVEQSVQFIADVADTLDFAHQEGLVHRDIKPANILIGNDGRVFLTDFGIAVTREQLLAGGTYSEGTLAYMPPEQLAAQHGRISHQGDIYSLGVVLYELLAGRLPFAKASPSAMRKAMMNDPQPPSTYNPAVPAALDSICLRALSREPNDRFPWAGELAEAVKGSIAEKRRRRISLPLLVFVGIVFAIGLGFIIWEIAGQRQPRQSPIVVEPKRTVAPLPPVPGATSFDGRYYKYVRANVSWHEAKQRCENMGGTLVIIENPRQQEFLAELLGNDSAYVLIGLTDEGHANEWRWVDDSPAEFTNWAKGEPNHLGGIEHYGAINPATGGLWLDIAAEHRGIRGFVCQWDTRKNGP